jgi:hypothetical protein
MKQKIYKTHPFVGADGHSHLTGNLAGGIVTLGLLHAQHVLIVLLPKNKVNKMIVKGTNNLSYVRVAY